LFSLSAQRASILSVVSRYPTTFFPPERLLLTPSAAGNYSEPCSSLLITPNTSFLDSSSAELSAFLSNPADNPLSIVSALPAGHPRPIDGALSGGVEVVDLIDRLQLSDNLFPLQHLLLLP
jgi:hypothetical protein